MKSHKDRTRLFIPLIYILFITANPIELTAQRFYAVVFDKLPQDYQLYPRNSSNIAKVPITGIIEFKEWNYMSAQVFRNGQPYMYKKAPITYTNGGNGNFNFEIPIKAELAEYEFRIYAVKSPDSVLMVQRKNIVAGDVYLFSGQSNSYNGSENSKVYKGQFARSFGYSPDYENYKTYNPADTLWGISNNKSSVGLWASEFQRLVIENYKIPICVINGGSGGSTMQYNLARTKNKEDLTTSSGRLYYRVKKAGLLSNIKAFIYRQGESETSDNAAAVLWKELMIKHISALKEEYPGLQQFYIPQINVLEGNQNNQGLIREYQRQLTTDNPFIKGFATIGTRGYDGVHYIPEGYFESAFELYRIIEADHYNPLKKANKIYSPNIKRAYFSTPDRLDLVLEFDQPVVIQQDTTVVNTKGQLIKYKLADNFGFTGIKIHGNNEWIIRNIQSLDNKVILQLFEPPAENVISYIPTNYKTSENGPFAGPFIKNSSGMRAFAFQNVFIETNKEEPKLESDVVFSEIPQDYQLFPRNLKSNLGLIKLAGKEQSGKFNRISVILLRDKSRVFYASTSLNYVANQANFSFSVPILAEKVNYFLRVYLVNANKDSILIAQRKELVSGDAIVLNGNKHAAYEYKERTTNPFVRTFGTVTSNFRFSSYNLHDTIWTIANSMGESNNIGKLAYHIADRIHKTTNIPIALINASDNFSTTQTFAITTNKRETNLEKLSFRVSKSGLNEGVRAYIMLNGDNDTRLDLVNWRASTNKHISEIKKLMPNVEEIYWGQMTIESDSILSAQIRELQRVIPNVITFPTIGLDGFADDRYSETGIFNLSDLITGFLLKAHYTGNTQTLKPSFPQLTKAVQSLKTPNQISLIFNSNISFQNTDDFKRLFSFDQKNKIEKIETGAKKLIFNVQNSENVNSISYLSIGASELKKYMQFRSLLIKNDSNNLALSFDKVKIQKAITSPVLKLDQKEYNNTILSWGAVKNASTYTIERKVGDDTRFVKISVGSAEKNTFVDLNMPVGKVISYRMFAETDSSESEESNIVSISLPDSLSPLRPTIINSSLNRITISWPAQPNAKNYLIERKTKQGDFKLIQQTQNTIFTDENLVANTIYEYRIAYITQESISKFAHVRGKAELILSNTYDSDEISIFPNPVQNKLFIKFKTPFTGTIDLIDLNGKEIFRKKINELLSYEIEVSAYPKGIYILKTTDLQIINHINHGKYPENAYKVILQD
jgi:hypothetical protein